METIAEICSPNCTVGDGLAMIALALVFVGVVSIVYLAWRV